MMENIHIENRVGGMPVIIGDCWIWAEINYLDSSTCYREYLPSNHLNLVSAEQPLVLLDDCVGFLNKRAARLIRSFLAYVVFGPPLIVVVWLLQALCRLK